MALRSDGARTKARILSSCVKLFLEKGFRNTTMVDIYEDAKVSSSSFQHLFDNKHGVLLDLEQFMYESQFDSAEMTAGADLPPVYVYAVETAIQLALTELNPNIREIYIETYTYQKSLDYIQQKTAPRLLKAFGPYQPDLDEHDFYILDMGTSGMMRGFMANPCDEDFTLEKKIESFLSLALRGYKVPEDEVGQVLAFIAGLDIRSIAGDVMNKLFHALAVRYHFSLDGLLPEEEADGAEEPDGAGVPEGAEGPAGE